MYLDKLNLGCGYKKKYKWSGNDYESDILNLKESSNLSKFSVFLCGWLFEHQIILIRM